MCRPRPGLEHYISLAGSDLQGLMESGKADLVAVSVQLQYLVGPLDDYSSRTLVAVNE